MKVGRRAEVSGHYAGPVTRLVAYALDAAIITVLYGVLVAAGVYVLELISGDAIDTDEQGVVWLSGFALWAFAYMFAGLAIAGRTLGKLLVGLKVVRRDGTPLRPRAAFVRTLTFPLSFALVGLGLVGLVVGRERRALHDVLAGSAVVYDWGDRPAELPAPLSRFLAEHGIGALDRTEGAGT